MRISRHRHKRQMSEINVVPYIDVMLVLLVIFMVTAPLMMEGVTIDLPAADASLSPRIEVNRLWFVSIVRGLIM